MDPAGRARDGLLDVLRERALGGDAVATGGFGSVEGFVRARVERRRVVVARVELGHAGMLTERTA